jgi:hypothetical protein
LTILVVCKTSASSVRAHLPSIGPPGARNVYLTFEGLRESRTIADKHTRVRVSSPKVG